MTTESPSRFSAFGEGGRFEPIAFLGRGNSGVVYRVRDRQTGQEIALKTLDEHNPERLYRLKQEFRSLAGIRHPNLVKLYELYVDGEECFFTMEFVDGVDFVAHVDARRLGGTDRFVQAALQLGRGLTALHDAGRVHRDVKPHNVLVNRRGRVFLLDFGFAVAFGRRALANDHSEGAAGSLAYMAPEILWGKEATPASDWYSAGVLFYEAISGRLPFSVPLATLRARQAKPAPLGNVPPGISEMVVGLLGAESELRPRAEVVLAQLEDLASPQGGRAAVTVSPPFDETPFVGRAAEHAAMRTALEAVGPCEPVVLHVRGTSGIGKSELVRRFLVAMEGDESVFLRGRCHPHEAVPYRAFDDLVDSLSRYLAAIPAHEAETVAPRHCGALIKLFPVLGRVRALAGGRDEQTAEPQEIRRRGFSALRELLARLAERRRVVLWIDDVQWSDPDSAALARELLRYPDPPGVLLILSYRAEDRDAVASFVPSETGERGGTIHREIDLGPLAAEETRQLATLLAGNRTVNVSTVVNEAAGSPLFVDQLVRHLAGRGSASTTEDLSSVLAARLDLLGGDARRLLEVVSVAGRPLAPRVAFAAAGLGEAAHTEAIDLQEERLLRSTPLAAETAVETYHDRIRELLVARLDPDALRQCHRGLAHALEREPVQDAQALFRHFLGAGEREPAGRWAIEAAERADAALAFTEAADIYGRARDLVTDESRRTELHVKLAEALANAGRAGAAGECFEAAAGVVRQRSGAGEDSLRLQMRAADQYLRSGALERGSALLREVLSDLEISLPSSQGRALLYSIGQRARLLWRGLAFERRAPEDIPAATRVRLDTCWAAASGLSLLDPVVADGMGVKVLIDALDAGDLAIVNRALGMEVARQASLGSKYFRRKSKELLLQLERFTEQSATPFDQAGYHRAVGTAAYFSARWREALEHCDLAARIWREQCRGAAWEIVTLDSFALSALAQMGECAELARRLPPILADADARGDVYAATSLRMGWPNLMWLAQDRPDEALEIADRSIAAWPSDRFLVQHYLHLIATTHADLYRGDVWSAWRRIEEAWPRLKRAFILSVASTRVELRALRARVSLAAAATKALPGCADPEPGWSAKRLIRLARSEARSIARDDLPTVSPWTAYLRGALARIEGRTDEARAALAAAAEAFDGANMRLHAAAARWRTPEESSDSRGEREREVAERAMREAGIAKPAAMAAVYCPV